jgi:hypothetical protein
MTTSPFHPPLIAVAPQLAEVDTDENQSSEAVTTCGRCRLKFVRHPSISVGDAPRWWLCPPCRTRLLGDETRTSSRWSQ